MSKPGLSTLAGAALLLLASVAQGASAPYCVVDFAGKRCWYQDLESCQKAAGEHGSCILNEKEIPSPIGAAPYCMMEGWRTRCVYQSLEECQREAATYHGECIANPNTAR